MKFKHKYLALFLAAFIALSACACSNEGSDTDVSDNTNPTVSGNEITDETEIEGDLTGTENTAEPDTNPEPEVVPPEPEKPVNIFENETLESFYDNAAFVGDSVMHGLQLYSARGITATTDSTFLTLASFAARHALSDVTEKSYHPTYDGVKMKSEDALALAGVDKVFIGLGLNDVRVTPKTYFENYIEFIGKIKEKCPDIKIFIISTTYPVESPNPNKMSRSVALDYRNQLHDLNTRLNEWCSENGAYFVDLISPIMSENGFLADEYTSDNYVHLTNKAYTIWEQQLIDYATALIETGEAPVSFPTFSVTDVVEETTDTEVSADVSDSAEVAVSEAQTDENAAADAAGKQITEQNAQTSDEAGQQSVITTEIDTETVNNETVQTEVNYEIQ